MNRAGSDGRAWCAAGKPVDWKEMACRDAADEGESIRADRQIYW